MAPEDPEDDATFDRALARAKSEEELAKLRVDRRLGELQLSASFQRRENWKLYSSFGGIVAALVAILAFFLSSAQWVGQSQQNHDLEADQRLQQALLLSSDSLPSKRLSGITLLTSFATSREDVSRRERALASLANILALEDNTTVREAAVEALKELNRDTVGPKLYDSALASLVAKSRIITRAGNLHHYNPDHTHKPNSAESKAESLAEAILTMLSHGARTNDLSGIYCVACNFSAMRLDGTRFDGAVLAFATFAHTSLVGSSFYDAELEWAQFNAADLRRAKITMHPFRDDLFMSYGYDREDERGANLRLPDFSCADLREADLSGEVLLRFWDFAAESGVGAFTLPRELNSSFRGANLADADLRRAAFLMIELRNFGRGGGVNGAGGYRSDFNADSSQFSTKLFRRYAEPISFAFRNANWPTAKLPARLSAVLHRTQTSTSAPRLVDTFSGRAENCAPVAPWVS